MLLRNKNMFKRRSVFLPVVFLCLVSLAGCKQNELDSKLDELRQVILCRDRYQKEFQQRVDKLRNALASAPSDSLAADLAYGLFNEYYYFNTDSARVYADRLIEYDSEKYPKYIFVAWRSATDGDNSLFDEAFEKFDTTGIPFSFRNDCYSILESSYFLLYPLDEKLCLFMNDAVKDSAIETDLKEMLLGTVCMFRKEYSDARMHFSLAYDASAPLHLNMKSRNAYLLAQSYKTLGKDYEYEYWLAQSAIHDFQVPIKAYSALQELAMAEMSRGQYKRASRMIELCMQDALFSKYWVRMNTAVEYESAIVSAFSKSETKRIWILRISAVILFIMIVILLMLYSLNVKQRKLLAETNIEKEEYIHRYMKRSVEYLGSVENYRHKLRVLLKEEGKDAVLNCLKGPSESRYSDFYKEFDETFLKIYPDFIKKVNALLKPEARFEDEHSMNLPLRVLAAIRLGVKESSEIALFLNCAPSSVYTYRSKLKANAISDKDNFESAICQIS